MEDNYNVHAVMDTELKEQAELVLEQLGLSMSEAIRLFWRQMVIQQELPLAYRTLTREELDEMLEEGLAQARAGLSYPVDVAFEKLRRELDI